MINKIMKGNIYHELLIDFGYAINISDYLWEIKKFFFFQVFLFKLDSNIGIFNR